MLQNAYFLAKIGADTAENEQHFAEILPTDALWRLRSPAHRRSVELCLCSRHQLHGADGAERRPARLRQAGGPEDRALGREKRFMLLHISIVREYLTTKETNELMN